MPVTALPTPPSRNDPVNFPTRADAFLGALPTFALELNDVQVDVNAAEASAVSAANTANSAANSAVLAAGVSAWVSGTTYTIGQTVWSPTTFQTFRRRTAGAGTTDPASDSTNWEPLSISSTSGITLNNNVAYKSRLSAGTSYDILKITAGNITELYGSSGLRFYTNSVAAFSVDVNGNIGVGTTTPTTNFDIVKASTPVIRLANTNSGATEAVLSFDPGNNGFNSRDSQIRGLNTGTNLTSLVFYTSNADIPAPRMFLNHLGNLGIGGAAATAAATRLTLQEGATAASSAEVILIRNSTSNGPFVRAGVNAVSSLFNPMVQSGDQYINFGTGASADNTGNSLCITPWSGSGNRGVRINYLGHVGIGTALPLALLHLTSGAPEFIMSESDQAVDAKSWKFAVSGSTLSLSSINDANTSSASAWTVSRSGNVINTQEFSTSGSVRLQIASDGIVNYGGIEIGYKNVPRVTGGIEQGKCFATSSGFTLSTGPSAGSTYSVYNDSGSAITITQGGGLTLRLSGSSTTGNRTIAARGMATIWFNSSTEAIIMGPGVS